MRALDFGVRDIQAVLEGAGDDHAGHGSTATATATRAQPTQPAAEPPEQPQQAQSQEPARPKTNQVFLSYARGPATTELALFLKRELEAKGWPYNSWMC